MSLYAMFKSAGPSGFGYGSTAEDVTEGLDLSGQRILVTGFNSGIGAETARVLAMRGATVYGAARTQEKAERACAELPGEGVPLVCELSEPDSVRGCVDAVKGRGEPLDAIICNAGIMALPNLETKYGYELQFLTNHIGHFILVTGLLDQLTDDGRVVMLSSEAHKRAPKVGVDFDNLGGQKSYSPWAAYGRSKLANLLVARELARRFGDSGKVANAVHPGVIDTNLTRHMNPLAGLVWAAMGPIFLKSIAQGAATQTYVAVHPQAATHKGEYWSDCNVAQSSRKGRDMDLAARLWEESERIVDELS